VDIRSALSVEKDILQLIVDTVLQTQRLRYFATLVMCTTWAKKMSFSIDTVIETDLEVNVE